MRLAAIMAGILLAAASQASGQDASPVPEAQRLMQGAADPDDLADLSAGGLISLRHKPSGLICQFGPGPEGNTLHVSPAGVICETAGNTEIDTLEAFRVTPASEAEVEEAVNRALGPFRGGQPVSGFTDAKSDRANAPGHVSRRYAAAPRGGDPLFVRIAYSQVGEWFVLQRVIATPQTAQLADADGERRLLAAIGQVMDREAKGAGR